MDETTGRTCPQGSQGRRGSRALVIGLLLALVAAPSLAGEAVEDIRLVLSPSARVTGPALSRAFRWGDTVRLRDGELRVVHDGLCQVDLRYDVRNEGRYASPAFRSVVRTDRGEPIETLHPALAATRRAAIKTRLTLRPGTHVVSIGLAPVGAESGTAATIAEVTLRIRGKCDPRASLQRPPMPFPGRGRR